MQLLEQMALETTSDFNISEQCLESAIEMDMLFEGVEIPSDFIKEVKKIADMFSKVIGEKAKSNKSLIKLEKKMQKKTTKIYGFGERKMGDNIQAISLHGKMKSLGYKCSTNIDKDRDRVETRYYLKEISNGYVNVIVTTSIPNNKWKENESYIYVKYVESSKVSDKVKEDILKLFK